MATLVRTLPEDRSGSSMPTDGTSTAIEDGKSPGKEEIALGSNGEETHDEMDEEERGLWRTNLFTLYARIFRIILAKWKERMDRASEEEKFRELDSLVLPSNEEWRHQVYYRLVDLQREIDLGIADNASGMNEQPEIGTKPRKNWDWEPDKRSYPMRLKSGNVDASIAILSSAINDTNGSMTEACVEPGWRVSDIILAAKVLQGDSPAPSYRDEAEMRRVFGLVYDVLRYKQILNQALRDVGFWYRYSEHGNRERIVWLLLYDMQGRKFSRRGNVAIVKTRDRALREAGIKDIEDALIETKTRLAASVSRLRIGGSALGLDELLPDHLRTAEGVNWSEDGGSLASGWVNTIKISSRAEFIGEMAKLELRLCINCNETELDENHYVFDPICPKVVNLHDKAREKLAMSELVTSHRFIFLERSLCLGAAALAQTIRCGRLCGPIVLTHSIAPRHTAYLAGLIADIEDAGRLLAFGVGEQRQQYEEYLGKLGLTNQQCRVFSERYVSPPPLAELERATVVLCSPPCSYTGVRDVVDLAVARGGDTGLLETLTNVDIELEQPKSLLTEQLTTLKHALTRPNVQLLIYEAHSILPSETFEMAHQVVQYANKMAADKFSREHPPKKLKPQNKDSPGKISRSGKSGKRTQSQDHKSEPHEEGRKEEDNEALTRSSADFEIPESDVFQIGSESDVWGEDSSKWMSEGCYLAVIKRKEMMQFNSLFMIKVAESKGLFGDPEKQQEASKEDQRVVSPLRQGSQNSSRKSFKRPKIQMDRISAATHSSILRSNRSRRKEKDDEKLAAGCPRHAHRLTKNEIISRSQISHSPISSESPRSSSGTPEVSSVLVPEKSKVSRENRRTKRKFSRGTLGVISGEESSRKTSTNNSKLIFLREENSDALQSSSLENSISALPNRFSSPVNRATRIYNHRNSSTFSFGYGARALANATQKISLINDLPEVSEYERDKENSWRYKFIKQSAPKISPNKVSRLYHPGGTLKFSRPEVSRNHGSKENEYFQGIPYLFPGTGNAAAAAGLDSLSID